MIERSIPENRPNRQTGDSPLDMPSTAQTTGRYIVVFAETETSPSAMLESFGLTNVADSRDFKEQIVDTSPTSGADATFFSNLSIAVVAADPNQLSMMEAAPQDRGTILSVSPELIHHVLDPRGNDYTRGYRDGVTDLSSRLESGGEMGSMAASSAPPIFQDNAQFTWGIQATQANASSFTGKGVKVAVLDTGFDSNHPDFAGRNVSTQSFIPGESPQDGHGHGTHCIGTACGPKSPATGPRYGVACEADIFSGKVLSNAGSGTDAGILAGIDWAMSSGCAVISMSLGADVAQVHPPYTAAGRRALDQDVLIVAAAGNNADRVNRDFGFVGVPANSPYIMAVGALNQQLDMAFFSARTLSGRGGQVDIAGPGFQVYSSWPMPTKYRKISGTSMATPHVSGLAAVLAEATGYRGRKLWSELVQEAHRLLAPSVDVGSGLGIAPQ